MRQSQETDNNELDGSRAGSRQDGATDVRTFASLVPSMITTMSALDAAARAKLDVFQYLRSVAVASRCGRPTAWARAAALSRAIVGSTVTLKA